MRVPEVSNAFVSLGLPSLEPMPFMKLTHQVAQKLHGLTEDGSKRVHDLVGLQVIMAEELPFLEDIKPICARLFSCGRGHPGSRLSQDQTKGMHRPPRGFLFSDSRKPSFGVTI